MLNIHRHNHTRMKFFRARMSPCNNGSNIHAGCQTLHFFRYSTRFFFPFSEMNSCQSQRKNHRVSNNKDNHSYYTNHLPCHDEFSNVAADSDKAEEEDMVAAAAAAAAAGAEEEEEQLVVFSAGAVRVSVSCFVTRG